MYQTIKHRNGMIEEGAFPTLEWFEKIRSIVNFQGANVVDIGCGEGMMGILAKEHRAGRVVSVDKENESASFVDRLFREYGHESELYIARFEDMAFDMDYDIVICSMILHWMDDGQTEFRRIADATKRYIVVIFREKNEFYEKENGNWFPTSEELVQLANSVGFDVKDGGVLLEQDHGKTIRLTIFERYKRTVPVVVCINRWDRRLDEAWRRKLTELKPYFRRFSLLDVFPRSYTTEFIDGRDLWGDRPFHPSHGKQRQVFLNNQEKESIQELKDTILKAGLETGFYVQDVTKRNVILKDEQAYLVDYDQIGTEPDIHL